MATGRLPDPNSSPLTAKGDLYTYSTVPAKLAVGNNGETLVADSSTSTGLRWQGNYAAGKNAVINGGFDIWQRGTSSTSSGYQTADRWYQGLYAGTGTFSQDSSTIPSGSRYSLKFTASATAQAYIQQAIETMNALAFANQTVILSAEVACSSSQSFNFKLQYSTSVDNSVTGSWTDCTLVSASATVTSTSTLARKSVIYTIPSTAKSLRVVIELTNTIANTATANIGNVQLELGSVATAFSRAGGNIAGELAACQRYYQQLLTGTKSLGIGTYYGNNNGLLVQIYLPVEMRTTPTLSATSGTNYYAIYVTAGDTFDSLTLQADTTTRIVLLYNNSQVSGTAGDAGEVYGNSASASVGVSAEL